MFYDGEITGYYPGNLQLSVCWYYNNSEAINPDEVTQEDIPKIEDYDEYYGFGDTENGYIEFYGRNEGSCFYDVGSTPMMFYNFTGLGYGNETKTIFYYIKKFQVIIVRHIK